jgi:GntR family transcriptional regulator/MocR family aminotransferase
MGTSSLELLLTLDRSRRRGLRVQLEDELRAAIRSGRLGPGAPVPSSRALAADAKIHPATAVSTGVRVTS